MKGIIVTLVGLLLVGCVSYPDSVAVPEGTELVSFSQVNQTDFLASGQLARWSGVIADVKNEASQTVVDVLYYPAMDSGRPRVTDEPAGRFRVRVDGFLDPAIYIKGKSITALGALTTKETAKIGEYEYEYPTISSAKLHLWAKQQPMPRVEFYYGWYGHPRWYWQGGVRHIYIVGDNRPQPGAMTKPSKPAKVMVNKR
jgi:outer membrane lipoprotein